MAGKLIVDAAAYTCEFAALAKDVVLARVLALEPDAVRLRVLAEHVGHGGAPVVLRAQQALVHRAAGVGVGGEAPQHLL